MPPDGAQAVCQLGLRWEKTPFLPGPPPLACMGCLFPEPLGLTEIEGTDTLKSEHNGT